MTLFLIRTAIFLLNVKWKVRSGSDMVPGPVCGRPVIWGQESNWFYKIFALQVFLFFSPTANEMYFWMNNASSLKASKYLKACKGGKKSTKAFTWHRKLATHPSTHTDASTHRGISVLCVMGRRLQGAFYKAFWDLRRTQRGHYTRYSSLKSLRWLF